VTQKAEVHTEGFLLPSLGYEEGPFGGPVPRKRKHSYHTYLSIALRVINEDREKAIDILDIKIICLNDNVELKPRTSQNSDTSKLFDKDISKTIGPKKIVDYIIEFDVYGKECQQYEFSLSFSDNYGRTYLEKAHT
jgi:hypothetical protein